MLVVLGIELGLRSYLWCYWQTISYMAERVVGTGSFGVVFQVYISDIMTLLFS